MNLATTAVQLLTCPTCDALPGEPCRTRTGRKLTDNGRICHSGRTDLIRDVWLDGYDTRDGEVETWRDRYRRTRDELERVRDDVRDALTPKGS